MTRKRIPSVTGRLQADGTDVPRVTIHIGGLRTSRDPLVLDTVLGSCIAACLYDPVAAIGGMNHFMLPHGMDADNPTSTRYGVHAMELLISDLMKIGANRKRFRAKVFGGGHVLKISERDDGVPQRNIEFVRRFLANEQIPIVKEDVGGYQPRRVLFHTDTSQVFVKYLGRGDAERTAEEEMVYLISLKRQKLDGEVELF
ncbi:MAG: chemotaxis protein CheD [Gammaproteobacteria bacterium]|nr:chemotaxis protein CheD [Gammaproteobacteria bacterium]